MRILITTQFGEIAGSTYSIYYLADGLKKLGHHIILAAPKGCLLEELARKSDIDFEPISFRNKWHWQSMRRLVNVVNSQKIDLINAQESKDRHNAIAAKWLFGMSAKLVFTRRQRVADNNPIKRWLHVNFAEKIIVVSYGLQRIVQEKGYPIDKTVVIHNGLKLDELMLEKDKIEKLRKTYNIQPNDKIIGSVSRLKEQDQLVKALRLLPNEYRLLLVGIDRHKFQSRFSAKLMTGLEDRIIFTGPIRNHADTLNHYALMNVHVLATQMDGFGLVLLEAMAMGVPTLGTSYGGVTDVITHEENGLLFENGQVEQLAQQIQTICEDVVLKQKMIANGTSTVLNRFPLQSTIEKHESLFQSVLARKKV